MSFEQFCQEAAALYSLGATGLFPHRLLGGGMDRRENRHMPSKLLAVSYT